MYKGDALYWVWLARALGVASKSFLRLIERFEDPYDIYALDSAEIEMLDFIGQKQRDSLCDKSLEASYEVLKFCKEKRVDIITYADKRYPARLKTLIDPPALLFCRGKFPDFNKRLCVAVVGTRKMSEYGRQSAYKIAYEMAAANAVVVSGMALGVDAVAACGAIGAGGETVAVLGSGIDVIYPYAHKKLYEKISKCGAVITEFMPSSRPDRYNFPIRNRIISGLCQATLLIEGDSHSGALITAKAALSQGREVFALPGQIDEPNSEAPNELIREGAYAALSSDDVIKHYDFLYHDVIDYKSLSRAKMRSFLDEGLLEKLCVSAKDTLTKSSELPKEDVIEQKKTPPKTADKEVTLEAPRTDNEALLSSLDDVARRVFSEMPIDLAVTPDKLVSVGVSAAEVITALTMLELMGLVSSLPGGLYIRK